MAEQQGKTKRRVPAPPPWLYELQSSPQWVDSLSQRINAIPDAIARAIKLPFESLESAIRTQSGYIQEVNATLSQLIAILESLGPRQDALISEMTKSQKVYADQIATSYDFLLSMMKAAGDDDGVVSIGSETTMRDDTKDWQPGIWQDPALFLFIGQRLYVRRVISHTGNTLTFSALPPGVRPQKGDRWILKQGLPLASGSNLIGKVSEPATVETPFTGLGDMAVGIEKIDPGADFKLVEIALHLSAAPTTGTQNLVYTLDSARGAVYDEVLLTIDLVANAVTDLTIKPDKRLRSGDVVTAAWTNTDGVTYGLLFKHQLL